MTLTREEPLEEYFRALRDVDSVAASRLVLELLDDGTPVDQIAASVLSAAQVRVGEMWERGLWSAADEHAATAVTESALHALGSAAHRRVGAEGRHVLVACAEGEWHTLPARLTATVAATGGARVTTLGPSLPAEHLGRRLRAGDVDVLALSCTLPTNLLGAARCIQEAHDAGVPVVAGGRAFGTTPQRALHIGADAWAPDPTALVGLVPELVGRPSDIPVEALVLDAVREATVALAYERMVAAFPRLADMSPFQQARSREDLQWIARFTGAAVLTDDVTVVEDFLSWLVGLLAGRVPVSVLMTSAHLVADVVEPDAPHGAAMLREAAGAVEREVEQP